MFHPSLSGELLVSNKFTSGVLDPLKFLRLAATQLPDKLERGGDVIGVRCVLGLVGDTGEVGQPVNLKSKLLVLDERVQKSCVQSALDV